MTIWLLSRRELTPEQIRAIELPHDRHQVIFGAPGSGKTQILLHRAAELKKRIGSSPDRFLILVYTNVLKSYIRSALDLLGLPENAVTTFDDWCKTFYEQYISRRVPWNTSAGRPDFDAIRRSVSQAISSNFVPLPLYDFILVDEGQDLDPLCFDIIRRIARHVTVCLDQKQQIYEHGSTEAEILSILGLRRKNVSLLDAYRCSPYVARLAAQFLSDPSERQYYLRQLRTEQIGREPPLLYVAASFQTEKQRLIEVMRQRLLANQQIGVLFHLKRQVFGFAQALQSNGIDVEVAPNLDFASNKPKITTIHSAKGLTFDSVFLPRLVVASFPRATVERIRNLLFVAVTRARSWVYLSTTRNDMLPILEFLKTLVAEGAIVVQEGEESYQSEPPLVSTPSSDLDFL
ncbi:MAG: 3'-5' exonuclease [Chloroflexota bacterium]|nr:AAA family ATPase [Dehalococcoidia bacterium]MDW8254911.1 3'-5' exonuclease [Chloroflexota bacterium]